MSDLEEFLDDFRSESHEALDVIESEIMAMEKGDAKAVDRVFRAMHSMKGGSGFLDLHGINHLAHQLENLLTEVREGRMAINAVLCDLLLRGADRLTEMIDLPDCGERVDNRDLLGEAAVMLGGEIEITDDQGEYVAQNTPPQIELQDEISGAHKTLNTSRSYPKLESAVPTRTFAMWLAKRGRVDMRDLFDAMMSQEYRALHPLDILKRDGFDVPDCIEIACHSQQQGVHPFRAALELGKIDAKGHDRLATRMANSRPSIGQVLVEMGIEQSLTVRYWLAEYYDYRLEHDD